MATASKTRSKTTAKAKKVAPAVEQHTEETEQELDLELKPGKVKKPIEIDEPEPAVAVDEKVEEDPLAVATEEDDSAEEISLDGEELNPFGDRWEE
jgi:hypothetical protein